MPALERLAWTAAAWDDVLHWQSQDRRQLRRIDAEHRLVYRLDGDLVVILACRYHDG